MAPYLYLLNFKLFIPPEWPSKFPKCGLPQQSPINLTPKELRDLTKKVYLANYEKPIGLIVENTGHGGKSAIYSAP